MNPHLQRALMLLEQSRHEKAEDELRRVLTDEPNNALAHAVLAICLANRERFNEAAEQAATAIHLSPEDPFPFYAQSIVLARKNQLPEAQTAIEFAIELNPNAADYLCQLARVHFAQQRWQAALETAEQGLAIDAEHVECTNLRAMALIRLGKNIEAEGTLKSALQKAPDDAHAHANMGWSLLEQNKAEQAMEHFREALRLDPEMEWARAGIVEAMKARYFVYRVMLNWFLWMVKLQRKAQWGVIIGAYVGYRLLSSLAQNNPALAPWLQPILILYVAFAVMTWVASPLFNLALRTSKFGRLALSDEEIRTSNWVGCCVIGAILLVAAFFWTNNVAFLGCAFASALLIPPLGRIYACQPGWPRAALSLTTLALGGLAVVITSALLAGHVAGGRLGEVLTAVGAYFFLPFIYGAIAAQFATNYLVSVVPIRGTNTGKTVWVVGSTLLAIAAVGVVGFVALAIAHAMTQPVQQ